MKLILASQSPRRQDILRWMGIPFEPRTCPDSEDISGDNSPDEIVMRLALHKAKYFQYLNPDDYILGADTVVVQDGEILGKPATAEMAIEYLSKLQGKTHSVYTGVALIHGAYSDIRSCRTDVTFCSMSMEEIKWYISTKEPFDKAGAYGLQGYASSFVEKIDGNYFNVVGLPAPVVYDMLKRAKFISDDRHEIQ